MPKVGTHTHKKHLHVQHKARVNRGNLDPRREGVFVTHTSYWGRRCLPLWGLVVELPLNGIMNCFNPNAIEIM